MPSRALRRLGCLGGLVFGLVVVAAVTALIAPWAFHIGGRWTPGMWWGFGELRTPAGDDYPVWILLLSPTSDLRRASD